MKKILLALLLIITTSIINAQTKIIKDTLFLSDGSKIIKGQDLHFGSGTNTVTRGFNFIYTSPISMIAPKTELPANWTGQKMLVDDFKKYHGKRTGNKFYVILRGGNIVKYWCDIEPALESKEVIINGINAQAGNVNYKVSVADELIKLKKLKDDGVITEDEFQVQKKKLLDK